MSKYTERIDAFEKDEKKKKMMFIIIVAVLIIIFLGGMVIGLRNILNQEGTYNPDDAIEKKVQIISTNADKVLSDFSVSIEKTRDINKVKLSVSTNVEIPDESISVSGDEGDRIITFIKHIKPGTLESVKKYYTRYDGKFGTDWSEHIIHSDLTAEDTSEAEEKSGRYDGDTAIDTDTVFYNIKLDTNTAKADIIEKNTGADVFDSVKASISDKISEIGEIKDFSAKFLDFEIHGEADVNTGKMKQIQYKRSYKISMTLSFTGDLKDLGTRTTEFVYTAEENHEYTYAGIELSKHKLSMEKGKTEALEAFRTVDEDVRVTWTSSNPDVASVDDRGYIKGHKTDRKPVLITAEISYLGNTYTDTCEVTVRIPVEEIKTSPKEITIKSGEEKKLSVTILPKSATIRDVMWFTEDSNIAEVDKDGNVTGKKNGQTKVFAVAEDGFSRSSCTVTVTD